MVGKLSKLKGRSPKELAERLRQGAAVMAERFGLSRFDAPDLGGSVIIKPPIFPILADLDKAAKLISQHEKEFILARAERLCEGKFDLLGLKG